MSTVSLKNASLSGAVKYNSLLAGNVAFEPITGAYDLLETQTLSGTTASVTFSGLDSYTDYKHLQIRTVVRAERSAVNDTVLMTFNGDTGSNYSWHDLFGDGGGTVASGAGTSQTSMRLGIIAGDNSSTNGFSAIVTDILDAFDTSKNTTVRSLNGVANDFDFIELSSGSYMNTSALTSLNMFPGIGTNFVAGSRFSLYGIRGA